MASQELEFSFKCNIRSECGVFVDLAEGGGQDPPVIGYQNDTWETNPNQIWEIYKVPGGGDQIVIKNSGTADALISDGHDRNVRAEQADPNDDAARWHLEGADINEVGDGTAVGLRNVKHSGCYLDLKGSDEKNGTPFITYEGNGGKNQFFKLWRR
ncbi:hard-surface inducible [Fusarium albosuccineum]|uniref:Hard-surface inducible n=1 Tax=Fusarium albosuccineum TaxID=1237068 RepID=A0A8H4LD49_9HYPO|nr:hard-surface inducible [Fusarium albosuccineum]